MFVFRANHKGWRVMIGDVRVSRAKEAFDILMDTSGDMIRVIANGRMSRLHVIPGAGNGVLCQIDQGPLSDSVHLLLMKVIGKCSEVRDRAIASNPRSPIHAGTGAQAGHSVQDFVHRR